MLAQGLWIMVVDQLQRLAGQQRIEAAKNQGVALAGLPALRVLDSRNNMKLGSGQGVEAGAVLATLAARTDPPLWSR